MSSPADRRVVVIKYLVNGMDDTEKLAKVRLNESFVDKTNGKAYWRKSVTPGNPLSDFVPETSNVISSVILIDGGSY